VSLGPLFGVRHNEPIIGDATPPFVKRRTDLDVVSDVMAVKQRFGNQPGITKARAELGAEIGNPLPDLVTDISKDVLYAKEAFQRRTYELFFPPPPWPCP
jgi:hypothetical protein